MSPHPLEADALEGIHSGTVRCVLLSGRNALCVDGLQLLCPVAVPSQTFPKCEIRFKSDQCECRMGEFNPPNGSVKLSRHQVRLTVSFSWGLCFYRRQASCGIKHREALSRLESVTDFNLWSISARARKRVRPAMSAQFPFDVFLSYGPKDKTAVRAVAKRLVADGLRVWFDEWVLRPGDTVVG